jgi:hypothetical protein
LVSIFGLLLALGLSTAAPQADAKPAEAAPLRASYLITVTDDFIVDAYKNGKPIPDAKRTLLDERYGATAERIDVEVRRGDWLVFNVVSNRMRWNGACYFGVAGCFAPDEFGFVSDRASRQWSACDSPRDAGKFIARRSYMSSHPVQIIEVPWSDGDALMRADAGANWSGSPVWGKARNTWIKVVVD